MVGSHVVGGVGGGAGAVKCDDQEGRGLRLLSGCLQRRGRPQGPAAPQVA